jgi:hypothetical protein
MHEKTELRPEKEHVFGTVCWQLKDDIELKTFDMLKDPALMAQEQKLLYVHSLHPLFRSSDQIRKDEKKGLFTSGITGMAFAPLNQISPRAKQLHQSISERVIANNNSYPPGLLAQYEIMLARLERGAPGCEFISFPGFNSAPSSSPPVRAGMQLTLCLQTCPSRIQSILQWGLRSTTRSPAVTS